MFLCSCIATFLMAGWILFCISNLPLSLHASIHIGAASWLLYQKLPGVLQSSRVINNLSLPLLKGGGHWEVGQLALRCCSAYEKSRTFRESWPKKAMSQRLCRNRRSQMLRYLITQTNSTYAMLFLLLLHLNYFVHLLDLLSLSPNLPSMWCIFCVTHTHSLSLNYPTELL